MAVPYQYSALNQFDNDPDDEAIDHENNLHDRMVEDSSSEDEEIVTETTSRTIGAIDLNPPDANGVKKLMSSIVF
jgi:hypothetical protein